MKKISCALLLLAMVAGSAFASDLVLSPKGAECDPIAVDLTSPEVLDIFRNADLVALGTPTVEHRAGGSVKVERQNYTIRDKDGHAIGGGTTTCSSSCGSGDCTANGCKVQTAGCSACSCHGLYCQSACTCTKESTYTPAPVDPQTPRDRTPGF